MLRCSLSLAGCRTEWGQEGNQWTQSHSISLSKCILLDSPEVHTKEIKNAT